MSDLKSVHGAAVAAAAAAFFDVMVHSHERQHLRLWVRLCQDDNIVSMRMLRQMQKKV